MFLNRCREYSVPLILGVVIALAWVNLSPESYHHFVHTPILGTVNFHFIINDIFMVFFFASAGIEIVNSLSPGGALNPVRKAVTPLMATAGGVIGPIVIFFILNQLFGSPEYSNGWGICTATDIALAWLVAKIVFGKNHPAVSFLLLLAVADDAVGLVIIAFFYPDPTQPTEVNWLLFVLVGMFLALLFNRHNVKSYLPYIFIAGLITWVGMLKAHIHPALALVIIVPFLPKGEQGGKASSALHQFESRISPLVDYGLILFGIANAGVEFSVISNLTWIIFLSLIIGKMIGISLFTGIACLLKFNLPKGMGVRDVLVTGLVGGMGLTVALFVAGAAFIDVQIQAMAKMGALFTIVAFAFAFVAGKLLRIKKVP